MGEVTAGVGDADGYQLWDAEKVAGVEAWNRLCSIRLIPPR